MLLGLRVEVDSLMAVRELPPFLDLLKSCNADASFFINIGPDRAGKAQGKLFQVGENKQQLRQNRNQAAPRGLARLYGTLLPAPILGKHMAKDLLAIQKAGFEIGLLGWDRVNWIREIATADEQWVAEALAAGCEAFEQLFGERPQGLALPDWRSNRAAFRLAQRMGFDYLSASRGSHPHLAVVDGEPVNIPQLPTTLPTLSELIGQQGRDEQGAVAALLEQSSRMPLTGHVFNLNLSRDGGKRLPLLQQLLAGWQAQGHALVSLQRLNRFLQRDALPWHSVQQQAWPAYSGLLTVQGKPFPA